MGGHPAGDVASEITVQTLASGLNRDAGPADLVDVLLAANKAIQVAAEADPKTTGMGATAVVAVIDSTHADIAHVGDSRAYLVRDGAAHQLTADHNKMGYLTQALGHGNVSPDTVTTMLHRGDRLLLCTDGLTGLVSDSVIGELAMAGDPETACDRLVYAALNAGGHDNVTVVLVAV
jgi:protein phosphatase